MIPSVPSSKKIPQKPGGMSLNVYNPCSSGKKEVFSVHCEIPLGRCESGNDLNRDRIRNISEKLGAVKMAQGHEQG